MKAKVIMPFIDKVSGKVHNPGDVIDCNAERFAEIKKYVVAVAKAKTTKKIEAEEKAEE